MIVEDNWAPAISEEFHIVVQWADSARLAVPAAFP